jgi:hypothetical protein
MKIIFFVIITFHGLIHLMGFLKAFKLSEFEQLSQEISKPAGVFWLLAALLFSITAALYLSETNFWYVPALAGVAVSSVLIIAVWSDAKYGMIANLIILTAAAISIGAHTMQKMVEREKQLMLSEVSAEKGRPVTAQQWANLPEPVQRWLKQSGVADRPEIKTVWLAQKAQMKMKPDQEKWYNAKAEQWVVTEKPAFLWKVNMDMSPVMKIAGRDKFVAGRGEMLIKMNGLINVVNEQGPKMDEGTLQRFLGEIVWYPSAALADYISWETIDNNSAKATMQIDGTTGSGIFTFDDSGNFRSFSAMRFMGNKPDAKKYEWVITNFENAEFNGIRIPAKMEATWKLDTGDWKWLKLEITQYQVNQ